MVDEETLKEFHWRPTRKEWLANAIIELDKEIKALELKKMEYEDEFERIEE